MFICVHVMYMCVCVCVWCVGVYVCVASVAPVAPVAVGVVDFECTYYFILLCGGLRWVIYIHIYTFN